MIRLTKILALLFAAVLLLTFFGCQNNSGDLQPSTPKAFHWNMQATVIRTTGKKNISTRMTIYGTYPEEKTDSFTNPINMQMELGKESGYVIARSSTPYYYSQHESFGTGDILHLFPTMLVGSTNEFTVVYMGLDLENQCVIFIMKDHEGEYIVASNDSNDTPEDILAHFDAYIQYYAGKKTEPKK